MVNWLKFLTNIITSEAFLEPAIMAILGYGIRLYGKNRKYRIILDITVDIVDYIEEHYKEWGIRGSEKMDKFLELFTEEFKKQIGRKPGKEELETARIRAEAQVQRARRLSNNKNK
ncbi:hypothetical protein H0A61_01116 [Koleobacter methoxysyntrophicus]|uniref:Uncharacterized protein n=1 Tax=Koleobacter methoxysyntrophicus TaxID=2751313 RepID=A0A8A0RK08_9FIRM|nr:hypothetical protein [Koleobacter methoxysyntrophicus]QSQ08771.1 hypothetical protein H0A61_01116 [Koleobacter methoxysyntrophicus]